MVSEGQIGIINYEISIYNNKSLSHYWNNRMADLNAMALFARVAEHRSFSEASRRAGVPVSTVSRKIAKLERDLGVRLLERSTRRLRLTEIGEEYYAYCTRAMQELDAGALMIGERRDEVSGLLRLSVPPSLERCLIVPLVAGFQARYPKARLRLWVTHRKLNLIEDGVDLAFRVGELRDEGLISRRLLTYRHILLAAPGYLAKAGAPRNPGALDGHRLIAFADWFAEARWTFIKNGRSKTRQVQSTIAVNDYNAVAAAAEAGLGIAELPAFMARPALQAGRLAEVLPGWDFSPFAVPEIVLSAVYPSNRNLPRLVRLFLDHCVENIVEAARGGGRVKAAGSKRL